MNPTRKLTFLAVARAVAAALAAMACLLGFAPAAHALSAGCTTLSAYTGTGPFTRNISAGSFDPSDTVTVSFYDNGNNAGGSDPMAADNIILRNNGAVSYYTYRSNEGSIGNHTGGATSAQLAGGLLITIKTTSYISQVSITCGPSVSNDATLSNLQVSAGTLAPSFSSVTGNYNLAVANGVSALTLTPTSTSNKATIRVNGSPVTSGVGSPAISLNEGDNPISLMVTAEDGLTTRLYSITATRAAAPPVANGISATVAANSSNNPMTLSTSGGTPTAAGVSTQALHGVAVASGTSISYTPTAGYSGPDSFAYTVSNGSGTSAPATVSIVVSAPQLTLAPAAGALPSAQVGSAYVQSFSAASGATPYHYAGVNVPPGLSLDANNGQLTGIPTTSGTYNLSVTATDLYGATGTASYSLTVAVAPLPVANPVSTSVAANSSSAVALSISGGAATSVAIDTAPLHGTATASGTSIVYSPNNGYSGTDSFTYIARNASGSSSPATVSLTISAPTLVLTPAAGGLPSGQVGSAYSQSFGASGGAGPYIYAGTGVPPGLNLDANSGQLTGTATASGSYNLSITATDVHGAVGNAGYTLTIGALPVPVANPVSTVVSASGSGAVTLSLSGGAATSVDVVTPPLHGTTAVSGTSILYTPTAGFAGADSFRYTASNASGTSAPATVSITVSPPTLAILPAAGALPDATIGAGYTQALNVSGGTAPYQFSATGLPPGLTINASSGTISGVPGTAGSASVSVIVTDAFNTSASFSYSLNVGASLPGGAARSASLYAGQSITLNLAEGMSNGPFTGAALLDAPPKNLGQASLSGLNLTFVAAAQASGVAVIRYTLSNRSGTSQPITLTVQVAGRTDPSKDQEVVGMLGAQTQSATRFARAQIDNFNDRLEQLHDDESRRRAGFNLQLGLPQSRPSRTGNTSAAEMYQALSSLRGTQAPAVTPQAAAGANDGNWLGDDNLSVWSGGYVNVSDSRRDDVKLDSTTVGVSAGADYRFFNSFTAGIGFGYGRDSSDIGSQDSRSKGESFSAALYGSYHPGPVFVDGLLGYSNLSFDSRRYVTDNGGHAKGSRDGDQFFGSLSSGYEFREEAWRMAPYGRVDVSSTKLDGFRESGSGVFDLAYAPQRMTVFSGVGGVRGQYGLSVAQAALTLRGRVEYSHTFSGDSTARVGYADVSDSTYAISTTGQSENTMTVALGVDFLLPSGLSTGLTYQGSYGIGDDSRSNALMFRMGSRF